MYSRRVLSAAVLFSAPSIVSLAYHAYVGSFTRFIADDFCSVSTIQRLGFLRSIKYWYFAWNGRYANSFVDGLLSILGSDRISYITPSFLLIWTLVTIFAVALTLPAGLEQPEKLRLAIPIGSLAVFSTLFLSPNVPQSLYWWGGMRAYTLSLFFLSLYIVLFQFYCQREQSFLNQRFGVYSVSFMLAFFIAGFSETLSPALAIVIVGSVVLGLGSNRFHFRSPTSYFLMAGAAGALVGLVVLVAAPGNAVRQEYFHRSTVLTAIQIALRVYHEFLAGWLSDWKSILGICLLVLGGIWAGLQIQPSGKPHFWYGIIFILFGSILAYCCFVPAAYSMSASPPERALITPVYFLVNGILAGSYFWGQALQLKLAHIVSIKSGISVLLFTLIVIASFSNVSSLYSTRMAYIQYAREWDEMDVYIHIEKDKGKEKVRVLPKQNWAGLDEPRNRPRFWLNVCMSDYYGIQVLAPAPSQP